MNDLKLKTGELAEYFIPGREDLGRLYSIRHKIFHAKDLQETLDFVQQQINEVINENIKAPNNAALSKIY